jgi:hypothetical protein
MSTGVSRRDRRVLGVGGAFVVAMYIGARGLPELQAWQAAEVANASALSAQLAAARADQNRARALGDSLRVRRSRLALLDSTLLTAPTAPIAAAKLASAVEDAIDTAHVRVVNLQLRSDSGAVGGMTRVSVRLTALSDVRGIAESIRSIESADVLLIVDELSVAQPDAAAPATKAESLRFELVVTTLARIGGGAS